jgi:Zn finger protein HypA/HybF involved in hydrogenase expression
MRPYLSNSFLVACLSLLITPMISADGQLNTVGKRACSKCHVQQQRTLQGTPHDSQKFCEACHSPGEKHLKAPSDPSTIFSFKRATAEEIRVRCRECHSNQLMERHAAGDVSCISCHSSHHYVRKKYLLKSDDVLVHEAAFSMKK